MKEITYEFNDGSKQTITVTDEFYAQYQELLRQEKRNHWRETRRHISLNYLSDSGIDLANTMIDLDWLTIMSQSLPNLQQAIKKLSTKQQKLLKSFYYNKISLHSLAKQIGVSPSALSQQLATIHHKLKKILEKNLNTPHSKCL